MGGVGSGGLDGVVLPLGGGLHSCVGAGAAVASAVASAVAAAAAASANIFWSRRKAHRGAAAGGGYVVNVPTPATPTL